MQTAELFSYVVTPAMILSVGVFVGYTNAKISDIHAELKEFKRQCFEINCKGKKS
jgi:hypothetical protein